MNPSRTLLPLAIALGLALPYPAAADEPGPLPEVPELAETGKTVKDFTPKGWKVLGEAKGDVNGDGRADLVVVLGHQREREWENTEAGGPPRPLVVALAQKDGSFRRTSVHPDAAMGVGEGGAFGDPFSGVSVTKRGAIAVGNYGGSRWRWSEGRYFLLKGKALELVCTTHGSYDSVDPDGESEESVKGPRPEFCPKPQPVKK